MNRFRRAVITGASTGIGAEFCRRLAPRSERILAISNEAEPLEAVCREASAAGAQVQSLLADLSTREGAERVAQEMLDGGVDLLVNNAGFILAGGFAARDIEEHLAMVRLHVETPLILMHRAIGAMKESGGGAIINLASMTVFEALPECPTYAATKAFLAHFGRSVSAELEAAGIYLQSLHPGWTRTALLDRPSYTNNGQFTSSDLATLPEPLWMDPAEVVAWSLAGLDERRSVVITGRYNQKIAETALLDYAKGLRHRLET